jgi:hypothetical protein
MTVTARATQATGKAVNTVVFSRRQRIERRPILLHVVIALRGIAQGYGYEIGGS